MKRRVVCGDIDQSDIIFIQDSSSSTGAGLAGLVYNSAGLTCYYARPLEDDASSPAAAIQIALASQTVTGAHTDGGFVEIDATNLPGFYRIDWPDAMFVAGKLSVAALLKGATNMAPLPVEFGIRSLQDMGLIYKGTVSSVAGGQTALTISTPRSNVVDDYIGAAVIRDVTNVPSATSVEITAYDGAGVITLEAAATFTVAVGDIVEIAVTITLPTGAEFAAALLDLTDGVETGLTVREHFRLGASAEYGKSSGHGNKNPKYRDTNDTKDRITATTDSDGNRTAVTLVKS